MNKENDEVKKYYRWSDVFHKAVMNLGIIGPCFFLAATMGIAVATGGTFTIGTHVLAYWEAIFYALTGLFLTTYAFIKTNFTKEVA